MKTKLLIVTVYLEDDGTIFRYDVDTKISKDQLIQILKKEIEKE